ncbi:MAG TPA: SPOR domain-containing protein [bacterium]|nr:SPOR domain-containing protein [bacterium]
MPGATPTPNPPASTPSPAPPPGSAVSQPVAPSRFHVQVGAFDARQNAEALVLRLRSLGYAVTLVEGSPYRVWVGGYVDQTTAQRLADTLGKAGFDAVLTAR